MQPYDYTIQHIKILVSSYQVKVNRLITSLYHQYSTSNREINNGVPQLSKTSSHDKELDQIHAQNNLKSKVYTD